MAHLHKSSNPFLRHLFAHSPRLVCQACKEMFLLGSLDVDVSAKGMKDRCPNCGAHGPFHTPSKQDVLKEVPEAGQWLTHLLVGIVSIVLIGLIWWAAH